MAKYVCDFEQVNSIISKLENSSNNLTNEITSFGQQISSDLSGWEGTAKDNFITSNEKQIELIKTEILLINEFIDFLKQAISAIESAESSLASLSI